MPLLLEKWELFFKEVAPAKKDETPRFFHHDGEYKALIIQFRRPVPSTSDYEDAWLSIVEYKDESIGDLALEVRLNNKFVAIFREGPETPWFLDEDLLRKSIKKDGRVQTFRDVLNWLTHPFDEIKHEVARSE